MTREHERRINEAAQRLMKSPLDREAQRRHDEAYIRATKALDPDTPRSGRESSTKRSA